MCLGQLAIFLFRFGGVHTKRQDLVCNYLKKSHVVHLYEDLWFAV
uniref:Uncharacterized protein n=1 Tax=Aegilops tauschii subsp. strangulata TaxID=200361 RepID=A0A452YNW1_AEGTS